MPDVELADDDEYSYVWALVDSGAGANVARRGKFPNSKPVGAPPIKLTVANGESMPNTGARKVTFVNPDGLKRTRSFYEANVDMHANVVCGGTLSRGSERFRGALQEAGGLH